MDAKFEKLVRSHLLNQEGVTHIAECRRFTTLYGEGTPANTIFFLEQGLVKLVKGSSDRREILLNLVRPGEFFGEDALFHPERASSAEVLQSGGVSMVPRELFLRFAQEHPVTWKEIAAFQARRNAELGQKLERLRARDLQQRILFYLAELAEAVGISNGTGTGYQVPLSQMEIATLVGATRETTSTALNALARRGLITLGRRRLMIEDPERLRAVATANKAKSASH